YQTALELDPKNWNAHYNMGNIYKEKGNMDKAFEHFREVTKLKPDYADAQNNVGLILELYYKNNREAITHYRQAVAAKPDDPGFHFNLGMALMNEGNLPEAALHFQQAIELKPDYEAARKSLKTAQEMARRQQR
ncbi:MAG TPA: tetratricopeptide repeat protein, partial [Smithellaceae bacterium]|nr:tetratricopeptide repeat protein [Smithellaceae bacterium]